MHDSSWPSRDLLSHRVAATPDRTALVDADGGRTWTYRELDVIVDETAGRLADFGSPVERIGVLMDARIAVVRTVHAAMRLGTTLVPLDPDLAPDELRGRIARIDPDLFVCERDTEALAMEVADCPVVSVDPPECKRVRSLDDHPGGVPGRPGSASDGRPDPGAGSERPRSGREEDRLIVFTSGTTGEPKGVRLTADNLVASATASAFRLGVQRGDRWLLCLPTYHVGGLAPIVRSTLYGTAVVLQRQFDVDATRRAIDEHDVTGVSLVPTMLKRLLDAGWEPPADLRFVLVGGAPTPPGLVERCEQRGVPIYPTYGLTEAASQVATATPEQAFEHPETVGQPLVSTDVAILDDGPCNPGEVGEIVVDGPTVSPGYLDDEHTEEAFDEHGLHTGDLGYRDDDGRLWVLGRTDDAIVTGGETVHPARVVDALREYEGVEDAAVVGLDDPEWGERVSALVVPADDAIDAEDLADHCRDWLAGYEVPKTWAAVDALPRTASGTVDRAAVRERLREE